MAEDGYLSGLRDNFFRQESEQVFFVFRVAENSKPHTTQEKLAPLSRLSRRFRWYSERLYFPPRHLPHNPVFLGDFNHSWQSLHWIRKTRRSPHQIHHRLFFDWPYSQPLFINSWARSDSFILIVCKVTVTFNQDYQRRSP